MQELTNEEIQLLTENGWKFGMETYIYHHDDHDRVSSAGSIRMILDKIRRGKMPKDITVKLNLDEANIIIQLLDKEAKDSKHDRVEHLREIIGRIQMEEAYWNNYISP